MVTQHRSVFTAIADPTRRAILDALRDQELSAGAIASRFPVSRPAVSRHIRVLRSAGLVRERRQAQQRHYSLAPTRLSEVDRWLEEYRAFWGVKLQALQRVAEAAAQAAEPPIPPPSHT